MKHSLLSAQTGHTHLRRLFWLRSVAIVAQCITLFLLHQFLSRDLPWLPMLSAIAFLATLNAISWWRLSLDYRWTIASVTTVKRSVCLASET